MLKKKLLQVGFSRQLGQCFAISYFRWWFEGTCMRKFIFHYYFLEDFFSPSKQLGNIYILKNFEYYRYKVLVCMKKVL